MADNEIRLSIKANVSEAKVLRDQLKDIVQEIKQVELGFKNNNITSGTAMDRFRELGRRVEALGVEEKKLVDVKTRLWHANNRVSIGFKSLATETKNVSTRMSSAFPTMMSMGNIIQDSAQFSFGLGAGIRAIGNNITQMASQIPYLIAQMGSARAAMGAMVATLTGPAGMLLAISLITTLATVFADKLFPSAKKVENSLMEMKRALLEIGEYAREKYIGDLSVQMNKLYQEVDAISASMAFWGLVGQTGPGGGLLAAIFGTNPNDMALAIKKAAEALKALREETSRYREETDKALGITGPGSFRPGAYEKESGYSTRDYFRRKNEADRRSRASRRAGFEDVGAAEDLTRIEQNYVSMFGRVSNVFASNMNTAWTRIFGEANSLFEQMLQSMAASLSQMFAQYGLGLLLGAVGLPGVGTALLKSSGFADGGTIPEPVVGFGKSGRMYTFAERGPEYVVPNHQFFGGGKQTVEIVGELRGRSGDLVAVVDSGNRLKLNKRF